MTLLACGVNHHSASTEIRERWVITPDQYPLHLQRLREHPAIREAAVLSTCNRTEVYCYTDQPDSALSFLQTHYLAADPALAAHWYVHEKEQAVRHVIRVASGLDSMVLGEAQIFGQVKQAYQIAEQQGSLGRHLRSAFERIFIATKAVRTHTAIGEAPTSVACAGICLIKQVFDSLSQAHVLFLGAGQTVELAVKHLQNLGVTQFTVANRSVSRAEALASQCQANIIPMSAIESVLPTVDIVIAATGSPMPLLGKGLFERIHKRRRHRPMVLLDLAVPRDIEPEVASLPNTYLYNLDHLQAIVSQNQGHRMAAVVEAEKLIDAHLAQYVLKRREHKMAGPVTQYREQVLRYADLEIAGAVEKLQRGMDPETVLREFSHRLTQKALDYPTRILKAVDIDKLG